MPRSGWTRGPGLNAILKAARRATKLTQRLLVFAKSEVVRTEVLDLTGAVRAWSSSLAGILPKDMQLVWRLEEKAGQVRMAPRHLEHIVTNLVTNARDAMPVGGAVVAGVRKGRSRRTTRRGWTSIRPWRRACMHTSPWVTGAWA